MFAGVLQPSSIPEVESFGAIGIELDVTDDASVASAASKIKTYLQADPDRILSGLVNNAGILIATCPVEWAPISTFARMYDVNALGQVRVTKSVLPLLRASHGRIVNVASIAGRIAFRDFAGYCMSKFAVEAFSDALRRDLIPWDITVSVVEPGVYPQTQIYEQMQKNLDAILGGNGPGDQEFVWGGVFPVQAE